MSEKLIEKMAQAMVGKTMAKQQKLRFERLARRALTAVHKHISQGEIEDCIEDGTRCTIDETVEGIPAAARAIRKLIAPPREKK